MKAGSLKYFMRLYRPSESRDADGDFVENDDELVGGARVSLTPMGGGETDEDGRMIGQTKWKIAMRFRKDMSPDLVGVIDGRRFEFVSIAETKRRRELAIEAVER